MKGKKLFGLAIVALFGFVVFSIFASAVILPPVVSIGASPNPTTTISTVTAVAVDLSGSGIANVKVYENGNLVKQCSSATCVFIAVHTTPGVRSYYATTRDNFGGSATSSTINVNFLNGAPVLNYIGNKNVSAGSELRFTVSGYDYNNDTLTYLVSGLPSGATFNSATGAFIWTPNNSQYGAYSLNFSVSDGSLMDSEVITINVLDMKAPSYSNLAVNPSSPAIYSPSQNYSFRARWTDESAISSVWIEFNGVNHTILIDGIDYGFATTGLKAGSYSYTWYARDSSGNVNMTPTMTYTVNKAIPALSLSVLPSTSVASNTLTNVTGLGCPSQLTCKLYRNGTEVNNSDAGYLADGTYNYVFNTTGNENYTALSVSATLYVNTVSVSGDSGDDDEGKTRVVSGSELASGYYAYLNVDDVLKFNLCGSPYYIRLTDIDADDDEAYFKVSPGMQSFVLGEGQSVELDLSANDIKDIVFRVDDVGSSRIKVYIKSLADSCAGSASEPMLISVLGSAEKIGFKGKSAAEMTYAITFLMAGIFLAALAVLFSLLMKVKRR